MSLRLSRLEDHEAVLELLTERDQEDFGQPDFTRSLLLDEWRSRAFEPQSDAVVVEDGDAIVGYAAIFAPGELAFVHPAREGEGIGTELLRWIEDRGCPRDRFRQRMAAGNRGARALMEAAGYRHAHSVHYLGWSGDPEPPVSPLPRGITLDALDLLKDAVVLHETDGLAFADNPEYHPPTLEAFCDEHLSSPDLHHPSTRIARRSGQVVGFVLSRRSGHLGYVDLLAVIPEARRQGIGGALLCHALTTLAGEGVEEVGLDVASTNPGALRLYRSLGMRDRHEVSVYEKAAR